MADDLDQELKKINRKICCLSSQIDGMALGINITRVNQYSDLPAANTVPDEYYHVLADQGTSWLPGWIGGTYYPKGFYYSNGATWAFVGEIPYQATQGTVDTGTAQDQFVSPATLANAAQWGTKNDSIQFQDEGINLGTAGTVNELDFTGDLTASRVGNKVTVNVPTGLITGAGVVGYLPYFNSVSTLDTSGVYWDATTGRLGIGTASPSYKLDVFGTGIPGMISTYSGINLQFVDPPTSSNNFLTLTPVSGTNLGVGTYSYRVVYYNANGETSESGWSQVTTTAGNQSVQITGIPTSSDPTVIGRKIYRGSVGWSTAYGYLIATIADNTTTSYLDTNADNGAKVQIQNLILSKPNRTNNYLAFNGVSTMNLSTGLTAIGKDAALSSYVENTAVGYRAGFSLTGGSSNVLVGTEAGRSITVARQNVALGSNTLYSTTVGEYNGAIGVNTLSGNVSGFGNVGLGYFSGSAKNTSSSYNVLVGSHCSYNQAIASNNIGIGAFVSFPSATGGNQLNIGNVIFGTGVGITMPMPSGKIGVGVTVPVRTLHAQSSTALTNTIDYPFRLSHITSGAATTNFGIGQEYELENASGTNRVAATQEVTWSDAVDAAEDAKWKLRLIKAGTLTDALTVTSTGQVGVGIASPNASAAVDITSTTQGLLLPRMTTVQRDAITPVDGLMIFCTDCTATDASTGVSQTYSSSQWRNHY